MRPLCTKSLCIGNLIYNQTIKWRWTRKTYTVILFMYCACRCISFTIECLVFFIFFLLQDVHIGRNALADHWYCRCVLSKMHALKIFFYTHQTFTHLLLSMLKLNIQSNFFNQFLIIKTLIYLICLWLRFLNLKRTKKIRVIGVWQFENL